MINISKDYSKESIKVVHFHMGETTLKEFKLTTDGIMIKTTDNRYFLSSEIIAADSDFWRALLDCNLYHAYSCQFGQNTNSKRH